MRADKKRFIVLDDGERNKEYKSVEKWASSFSFLKEENILFNQAENYILSFGFLGQLPEYLMTGLKNLGFDHISEPFRLQRTQNAMKQWQIFEPSPFL